MRNDILFILLNLFVGMADFSTENECKPNTNREDQGERLDEVTRVTSALKRYISCRHDLWSRSNGNKTKFHFMMRPKLINFDEDSGKLDLLSWMEISGSEKRLKWNRTQFRRFSTTLQRPDLFFIVETDDIYEHELNRTYCHIFWDGDISCSEDMHQTMRCQSDLTLWPYDRYTCTMIISSSFLTADELDLRNKSSPVDMSWFKSDGKWNFSVSRITKEEKKKIFNEDVVHPKITIEFILDRLHTHLRRRFVAPAAIMMIMTLTALWLNPKSYERLAVASLNIVIHMMCIKDLHWVLPRNGVTVPNMLLFYINSFILATMVLPLTFLLGKLIDLKISTPKWISSNIDWILGSKAGHFLLVIMLDPEVMSEIEIRADDTNGPLSTEMKDCSGIYMAIFFGWISFFSFLIAYILMYILLIPDSASGPPIISIS